MIPLILSLPGALTIKIYPESHLSASSTAHGIEASSSSTGIVAMDSFLPSCFIPSPHCFSSEEGTKNEVFER